jgi:ankyrin repeat protein
VYLGLSGELALMGELLEREVGLFVEQCRTGDPVAEFVLRETGRSRGTASARRGDESDLAAARDAVAYNRGFPGWEAAIGHSSTPVDLRFEAAAEAIHWGQLDVLRAQLDARPDLVRSRSAFPHHAMLIHHVAANGIEISRQVQSPENAVEVLELLLGRGAEPDATCDIYGPAQTTLCLLVSSCVPAAAGVQAPLVEALCRGGANPDGLNGDGLPLWTAIWFGYTEAVDALARAGARIDNLVFAAALGDVARLAEYLPAGGRVHSAQANSARVIGPHGPALDPDHQIEYAVIYASMHGRRDVVEYLLSRHPDLTVAEPVWGSTALSAARWGAHEDLVTRLEGLVSS